MIADYVAKVQDIPYHHIHKDMNAVMCLPILFLHVCILLIMLLNQTSHLCPMTLLIFKELVLKGHQILQLYVKREKIWSSYLLWSTLVEFFISEALGCHYIASQRCIERACRDWRLCRGFLWYAECVFTSCIYQI